MRLVVISFVACLGGTVLWHGAAQAQNRVELRPPSAFASIADPRARSRMLFTEAGKVIMSRAA